MQKQIFVLNSSWDSNSQVLSNIKIASHFLYACVVLYVFMTSYSIKEKVLAIWE